MSTTPDTKALVLGGGGSTGNAWLIGLVAGLHEAEVDVTDADLTIGTSAGSTAAAQLAGAAPNELYEATQQPIPPRAGNAPVTDHLARTQAIIDAASDPDDMRRRMGAAAMELEDDAWHARWRATVAARLPSQDWPSNRVLVTAVRARTGEPVALDRDSGVDLADAIAASCSGRIPYRIGDELFIDGGYRRNENADLAAGCSRVLVLSPFGGRSLHPPAWGMQLATQVEELRAGGSLVETIGPESEELFGANAMDLSLRPAAARAGHEQGGRVAEQVGELWT
jgi:NTE family protein